MATIDGAGALGIADETGSIEVRKAGRPRRPRRRVTRADTVATTPCPRLAYAASRGRRAMGRRRRARRRRRPHRHAVDVDAALERDARPRTAGRWPQPVHDDRPRRRSARGARGLPADGRRRAGDRLGRQHQRPPRRRALRRDGRRCAVRRAVRRRPSGRRAARRLVGGSTSHRPASWPCTSASCARCRRSAPSCTPTRATPRRSPSPASTCRSSATRASPLGPSRCSSRRTRHLVRPTSARRPCARARANRAAGPCCWPTTASSPSRRRWTRPYVVAQSRRVDGRDLPPRPHAARRRRPASTCSTAPCRTPSPATTASPSPAVARRLMDASEVIARFGLEPLPVEGGLFRQIWRSPADADAAGRARRSWPCSPTRRTASPSSTG